jgi:hypothetical protein
MFLTRLGYRELVLELFYIEYILSRMPKQPPMAKEKRHDKAGYLFKLLLEETPTRHRIEMMDNFTQILE